VTLTPHPLPVP